jgi:hypothetical protein
MFLVPLQSFAFSCITYAVDTASSCNLRIAHISTSSACCYMGLYITYGIENSHWLLLISPHATLQEWREVGGTIQWESDSGNNTNRMTHESLQNRKLSHRIRKNTFHSFRLASEKVLFLCTIALDDVDAQMREPRASDQRGSAMRILFTAALKRKLT